MYFNNCGKKASQRASAVFFSRNGTVVVTHDRIRYNCMIDSSYSHISSSFYRGVAASSHGVGLCRDSLLVMQDVFHFFHSFSEGREEMRELTKEIHQYYFFLQRRV